MYGLEEAFESLLGVDGADDNKAVGQHEASKAKKKVAFTTISPASAIETA